MTRDAVSLTVRRGGGSAVIEVTGTLDATTAPVLMERVRMLLARGVRRLRIDLDGIEFIDSRGLAALIVCRRRAHHSSAELRLSARTGPARRLLEVTGLAGVYGIDEDA
jgi:anti-sigma B factor antagonist